MRDHIRHWEGNGFSLDLFDTGETDSMGKSRLSYSFADNGVTIFEGGDFGASPLHAIDSDETVRALLGFLSLQAGDTDSEYFDSYTPEQLAWRDDRAEELALFCEQGSIGDYGTAEYGTAEVCVDCYFAHHYGAHEHEGHWYAGESDTPSDRKPLALLEDYELADNTDLETEEGMTTFSWSSCEGCGSTLGGARYRLALFTVAR